MYIVPSGRSAGHVRTVIAARAKRVRVGSQHLIRQRYVAQRTGDEDVGCRAAARSVADRSPARLWPIALASPRGPGRACRDLRPDPPTGPRSPACAPYATAKPHRVRADSRSRAARRSAEAARQRPPRLAAACASTVSPRRRSSTKRSVNAGVPSSRHSLIHSSMCSPSSTPDPPSSHPDRALTSAPAAASTRIMSASPRSLASTIAGASKYPHGSSDVIAQPRIRRQQRPHLHRISAAQHA